MRLRLAATILAASAAACGGSSESPRDGSPSGGSPNPCANALAQLGGPSAPRAAAGAKGHGLGFDTRNPRDLLALHRLPRARGGLAASAAGAPATRVGDLVVLSDDGSLIIPANRFDLGGLGLRFEPNREGGYDVRALSAKFREELGSRVELRDDDTREQAIAFSFPFYGARHGSAFVNSDGNLTFGTGDVALDERSLGRVLSGAPRVAAFFADLNPEAGGLVMANAAPDALTVTWCGVPDYDETGRVTAQASLLPDGTVEIRIDESTNLEQAVVALSPGSTTSFAGLDLSAAGTGPAPGGAGAVGERFAEQAALDLVAASRRALAEAGDAYDQLLFWSDTRVIESGTFAFETTVRNSITGIGADIFDIGAAYGSPGRLASVVLMDNLAKYSADPGRRVNGENTTLALVAHESGHRWGATLRFRDARGAASTAWLGRQLAHWSFFCHSDASVLEGNAIEDRGGGSFRTVEAVQRYGPFDLYAMGLLSESEVPSTFYVDNPSGANFDPEAAPQTGVSFSGTRREVTIADVVAALGPRDPPASQAPRQHRQAWVYVVGRGRSAEPAAVATLDTIRRDFEGFFAQATGGRMSVDTRLD